MNTTPTPELSAPEPAAVLEFGPFRYEALRRQLSGAEGPCRVGSRAFELLGVLLESPGRFYNRAELEARVWPATVVEETSLRVHMSALRRVLGDGREGARYIATVPGRGYAFVAPVRAVVAPLVSPAGQVVPPRQLRARTGWPIGRDDALARLGALVAQERLVSVVGPGGVGKTTMALCVAELRGDALAHGACFADLGEASDPAEVAAEVARACGVTALEEGLRERDMLVVLDNCEHVLDSVAELVERLMPACPGLHFLATTREPIGAKGEQVFLLPPLDVPEAGRDLGAEALMGYSAVRLFVERARAACGAFEVTAANASAVARLCALLDGVPLALELAALQVHAMGVSALVARGDDLLHLLTRGRRTAAPRHRTLRALLDWSYRLLSDSERRVLQRLAVFRGAFNLDEALALPDVIGVTGGLGDMLSLCAKSMLVCEAPEGATPRYRLLHTVRLFAEEQAVA